MDFITNTGLEIAGWLRDTTHFLLDLDGGILLYIQERIRQPELTPIVIAITRLGNKGVVWIVISVVLLFSKKTRKVGCTCILALLCSLLVNNMMLKNLVARVRPYEVLEGLTPLIRKPSDFSFPSGHTGGSFAPACVLYRQSLRAVLSGRKAKSGRKGSFSSAGMYRGFIRSMGILALVLAALIGFSRLYLGVHYPSDVIAGVVLGIACGILSEWAGNQIFIG